MVEDRHEPIIDRETFELVQEKTKERKRADAWGNYSIFAGLVKCGQCGNSLNIRRANQKGNDRIYTCSLYNKYGVRHCSQHRILYDTLYGIVLNQIQNAAQAALSDEEAVAEEIRNRTKPDDSEKEAILKSIAADTDKLRDLERIISRMYEDAVTGRLNEETFASLLKQKQTEQETLKNRVERNEARLAERTKTEEDDTRWREIIREYTDIQELDAETLNRLIRSIVIYEDFTDDTVRQTVEIHWNFRSRSETLAVERNPA